MKPTKYLLAIFLPIIVFPNFLPAQNGLYQNWVRHYAGPFSVESAEDIAVDQYGNVYIASESFDTTTSSDYAVIKYDSDGNMQWTARYSSPGQLPDRANAIAVDVQGNVYVTGRSVESYQTSNDYLTVKYNSEGVQQWTARFNGPGNHSDWAQDIVVDDSSNVYVTGYSAALDYYPFNYNYTTIKYDTSGNELWVAVE